MKKINLHNGNISDWQTVDELTEEEVKTAISLLTLLPNDSRYDKAEFAASEETQETDRDWLRVFVENYDGDIIFG